MPILFGGKVSSRQNQWKVITQVGSWQTSETLQSSPSPRHRPLTLRLARGGVIAAAYVVLVFAFAFASFGPIQLRVAEALTVMPLFYPEAIPGLWIGCMLANILGGYGPWDIFAGSAITGLAAILTWLLRRRRLLALAAPVVLNAFLVSLYLAPLILHVPYWPTVLTVGIGEALAVYGLGWPLARWWERQMTSGSSLSRWLK